MPSPHLPPPLLPPYSAVYVVFVIPLFFSLSSAVSVVKAEDDSAEVCVPAESPTSPCPPFNTTPPPFPFSSSPGCGHPSFVVQCSSPHSLISINNISFHLLDFDADSSTLVISPHPINTTSPTASNPCSSTTDFPSIPSRSINVTGSPFRISDAYCSRLSVLKPCPPPSLPNCSICPWHCSLVKNPIHLFGDLSCGSTRSPGTEQRCQDDVLGYLDNFLRLGIQIEWEEEDDTYFTECEDCKSKNGVCGFNSSDPKKQFLCYGERVKYASPWVQHSNFGKVSALCSIFILAALFCFVAVAFFVFRNKTPTDSEDPTTLFLHRHRCASLLPPVFTYDELEASTNRFDPKRKIGDGGFGSVYLGQLPDGRIVAVKYLHRQQQAAAEGGRALSNKLFCNEILILSSLDHPNLVKLHGYCSDPRGLLLVYDYVPNGTLAEHLHSPKRKGSLSWQIRVDMALQVAMAIEYLHCSVDPPIVHRDITTTNIFVERDLRVKVGDFGLSRLLVYPDPNSSGNSSSPSPGFVWTGPQGTPGYLDPDYHHSFRLTEKSDVYSFGVVLLELITGMKAVDLKREKQEMALVDMVVSRIQLGLLQQVVDPAVVAAAEGSGGSSGVVMESVGSVAELAFRCVAADKDDRPDVSEVVAELRRIWNRTRGVKMSHFNVVVVPQS